MFANPDTAPRYIPLAILAASVAALGAAYIAEYAFGLEPCILCLYQRLPFVATGLLALAGLPALRRRR